MERNFGKFNISYRVAVICIAIVACTKFCDDTIAYNGVILRSIFHRIWIIMENYFVKWALVFGALWLLYLGWSLWMVHPMVATRLTSVIASHDEQCNVVMTLLHGMVYHAMPLWRGNFLQNNHKVHSMPRSKIFTKTHHVSFVRARYGVLLFVSSMSDYCSAAVVTVLYVISNYTR